jgi:anti-sigma factor RsiW
MIDPELQLQLQAHADGELDPAAAARVTARLAQDPEARHQLEQIRSWKALLRGQELPRTVPESRAFHWSKIARDIEAGDRASARERVPAPGWRVWYRWLVPVAGAAALVLAVLMPSLFRLGSPTPGALRSDILEAATETMIDEASSISFRSESEAMTVVWVQTRLD